MDLNLVLWIGGMLFSLSVFVVKVGFGLGLGRLGWKGICLTLVSYLGVFLLAAVFSASFIEFLEPVVRKGPYLHVLMALGLMAWGIYLIRHLPAPEAESAAPSIFRKRQAKDPAAGVQRSALFLLLPCPVCLTAIIFSTWAALHVFKLPSLLVGSGLGIVFILLSMLIYFIIKVVSLDATVTGRMIGLGLSMIGIGLYFLTSLFLPAQIEAAKSVYQSFVTEGGSIVLSDHIGVFVLLLAAILIGFLLNKRPEVSE